MKQPEETKACPQEAKERILFTNFSFMLHLLPRIWGGWLQKANKNPSSKTSPTGRIPEMDLLEWVTLPRGKRSWNQISHVGGTSYLHAWYTLKRKTIQMLFFSYHEGIEFFIKCAIFKLLLSLCSRHWNSPIIILTVNAQGSVSVHEVAPIAAVGLGVDASSGPKSCESRLSVFLGKGRTGRGGT